MRRLGLAGLLAALLLAVGGPAFAQDLTEYWDVTIDVQPDGSFEVTEVIGQRFNEPRRGIYRYIPVTERLAEGGLVEVPDGEAGDWFQRIRIEDLNVSVATASDETEVTRPSRHDPDGLLSVRIGKEDEYVQGLHEYVVSYRVEGAMLRLGDSTALLRWDVVGNGWQQPILTASVRVNAPGGLRPDGICVGGGGIDGTACTISEATDTTFVAAAHAIPAYTPLSIELQFDSSAVRPSEPLLQRRFTLLGALWGDWRAIPLALLMAALVGTQLLRLLYREGRDRDARGDITVDGRMDTTTQGGVGVPRRLFEPRTVAIEYRPPDDLRPGQLGLILDERVDPVDVSATVVDLAVRGHLVIEEVEKGKAWWTRTDWLLKQQDADTGALHGYERKLLDGLFDGRTEVMVSDLKGTFAADYAKVETALYEDGRKRRWFAERPDKVRAKYLGLGIGGLIGWTVVFGLGVYFTRIAIVAVPAMLASLVLLVAHKHMPRRTPAGSALLTRTLGFRQFIETAETNRAEFAEKENLFVEYLPYAVVFGATDKWARAFEGLAVAAAAGVGAGYGTWYVGSRGGMFDARAFSSGLTDFSASMGTAAVTAPPSSSSGGGGGFSGGGGFGGGGGGSW